VAAGAYRLTRSSWEEGSSCLLTSRNWLRLAQRLRRVLMRLWFMEVLPRVNGFFTCFGLLVLALGGFVGFAIVRRSLVSASTSQTTEVAISASGQLPLRKRRGLQRSTVVQLFWVLRGLLALGPRSCVMAASPPALLPHEAWVGLLVYSLSKQ